MTLIPPFSIKSVIFTNEKCLTMNVILNFSTSYNYFILKCPFNNKKLFYPQENKKIILF